MLRFFFYEVNSSIPSWHPFSFLSDVTPNFSVFHAKFPPLLGYGYSTRSNLPQIMIGPSFPFFFRPVCSADFCRPKSPNVHIPFSFLVPLGGRFGVGYIITLRSVSPASFSIVFPFLTPVFQSHCKYFPLCKHQPVPRLVGFSFSYGIRFLPSTLKPTFS